MAGPPEGLGRLIARGGLALVGRQLVTQVLTLVGGLVLLRFLEPEDLAVYAFITVLRDGFTLTADLGLGTTLIQQEQPVERAQWQGYWSLQLLVALTFAIGLTLGDASIARGFGWPLGYGGLLTLLGWSLLLVPSRTVAAVILQKKLDLERFALLEVSESVIFVAVAVSGAVAGWGAWAIAWGVVARFLVGAVVAAYLQSWPLGWHPPWQSALRWKLGLTYQAGSLLTLLKESTLPVLLSLVLPVRSVGYLKWAVTIANLPLVVPLSLDRLLFPVMSRVQKDPQALRVWVLRSVQINNLLVWGLTALLVSLAPALVETVLGTQWRPALGYLYGLLPITLIYSPLIASIQAFQALGRPQVNFWLNLTWLILLWPLTWFAVPLLGPFGFVTANVAINVASLVVLVRAARFFKINFFAETWPVAGAGVLAAAVGYLVIQQMAGFHLFGIAVAGVAVVAVYAGVLALLWRERFADWFGALKDNWR